jgi:hypothetical protein
MTDDWFEQYVDEDWPEQEPNCFDCYDTHRRGRRRCRSCDPYWFDLMFAAVRRARRRAWWLLWGKRHQPLSLNDWPPF